MLRNKCYYRDFPMYYPPAQAPAAFIPMAPTGPMPQEMAPYQMMPVMPAKIELAEAYVPYQYYCQSYQPDEAMDKGTMFPELYKPYFKTTRDIGE